GIIESEDLGRQEAAIEAVANRIHTHRRGNEPDGVDALSPAGGDQADCPSSQAGYGNPDQTSYPLHWVSSLIGRRSRPESYPRYLTLSLNKSAISPLFFLSHSALRTRSNSPKSKVNNLHSALRTRLYCPSFSRTSRPISVHPTRRH